MSNPASISGVDLTTPQGRQILQDALDVLYGLIQKAGGVAAGPTTFDELRVRMLTVLGTINVVPEDKPPANVNSRLVTPWLTGQRGRGEVWRFEDQNDGGDLLEVRSQPYLIGTPTATSGDWEFRFTSAQRDPAGAYRSLGAIRFSSSGRIRTYDASETLLFDSSAAAASPLTTKGDIFTRDATADARLPIGTNNQLLTADSSAATGNTWKSLTDLLMTFGTPAAGRVLTVEPGGAYPQWEAPSAGSGSVTLANDPLELVTTTLTNDTVQLKDGGAGEILCRDFGAGTGPGDWRGLGGFMADLPGGSTPNTVALSDGSTVSFVDPASFTGGTFADGVTCIDAQTQVTGVSLSKTIGASMLAADGESLLVHVSGNTTGTLTLTVFGTSCFSHAPANPGFDLYAKIVRKSSTQVRVSAWIPGVTPTQTTVTALSGTVVPAITAASGVVENMQILLLSQSPYVGSNVLVPVAPGTVVPGVATMPSSAAVVYDGTNAKSARVTAGTATADETIVASTATVAATPAALGSNPKVWHSDGKQYAFFRTATTTGALYNRPVTSTTWTLVGSTFTVVNDSLGPCVSVNGLVCVVYNVTATLRIGVWDGSTLTHYSSGVAVTPYHAIRHNNSVWVVSSSGTIYVFDTVSRTWSSAGAPTGNTWSILSMGGVVYASSGGTNGGIYAYSSGTTWSLLKTWISALGSNDGNATNTITLDLAALDNDTLIVAFNRQTSAETRLYRYVISTSTFTALPVPAGWASGRSTVWIVTDDVSDPTTRTLTVYYTASTTVAAAPSYFQVVTSGTVTASAAGFTASAYGLPRGFVSEGLVEPRTTDVSATAISLTPCSPAEPGKMLLSVTIDVDGGSDTFTCDLWVPGLNGQRARATLTGTATGGTRSGNQVTGLADGVAMTVQWDAAADGFTDGSILNPAPFVRLYRE